MSGRITEASAVLALRDYYIDQGRFPRAYECNAQNGLPHYTTYLRIYESWSAAISAARSYISAPGSAVSALIALTNKRCMRPDCTNQVRDPSKNIRHCQSCRRELFDDDNYEEYYIGGVMKIEVDASDWETF
jgi:hypothetical protein